MLINPERPPFYIFRHYATFFEKKSFSKISSFFPKIVLRFLNLRYSADFRRSRLVLGFNYSSYCSFSNKQRKILSVSTPIVLNSVVRFLDNFHLENWKLKNFDVVVRYAMFGTGVKWVRIPLGLSYCF